MPKTVVRFPKRISFRVGEATHEKLVVKAKSMGLTLGELLRKLVEGSIEE